jgi:hypothetical protein
MLRNNPETIIEGCIGTKGHIEYFFKAFGTIAILFIEMKLKVGNDMERLKAIAQVIVESDGMAHVLVLHFLSLTSWMYRL